MVEALQERSSLGALDNAGDKFWEEERNTKDMTVHDPEHATALLDDFDDDPEWRLKAHGVRVSSEDLTEFEGTSRSASDLTAPVLAGRQTTMLNDAISAELASISESIGRHMGLDMVSEMSDEEFIVKPERPTIMLSLLQRSETASENQGSGRFDMLSELEALPKEPELPWESTSVESGGLRMRYPLHSQELVALENEAREHLQQETEESSTDLGEDVWNRNELSYLSVPTFSSAPPIPIPLLPPLSVEPVIEVPPLSRSELQLHREAEEVARILKEREESASVTPIVGVPSLVLLPLDASLEIMDSWSVISCIPPHKKRPVTLQLIPGPILKIVYKQTNLPSIRIPLTEATVEIPHSQRPWKCKKMSSHRLIVNQDVAQLTLYSSSPADRNKLLARIADLAQDSVFV